MVCSRDQNVNKLKRQVGSQFGGFIAQENGISGVAPGIKLWQGWTMFCKTQATMFANFCDANLEFL